MSVFPAAGPSLSRHLRILLVMVCLLTQGCTLLKLRDNVSESLSSTILVGHVSTSLPVTGFIVVVAYTKSGEKRTVAHYTTLHDAGEFELMVGEGTYFIFAYMDRNANLVYDPGESAGWYGEPKPVAAPAGGVVLDIDFSIPEKEGNIDVPPGFRVSPDEPKKLHSRLAGAIMDFDDEIFSEERGRRGFWEPATFFKEIGGNVYFIEEYDPKKIPILFVHGAGGSPKGWEYFVRHIDRTRFQPWFFYYPSGARIKSMSYLLFWKLFNLQLKYKFDTLYLTAYSMGGLVSRSFLLDYADYLPSVKLFISLATPWGGDKMAEYGVKQSPAVIPSWIDMQPEGEFIQSLYRRKLSDRIGFYMFYGHRGNRSPFQSNNDGTITLSSLLDWRPQSEAKMCYAFNEDHGGILFSDKVLAQYNTLVNAFDGGNTASRPQDAGYLRLHFSYESPSNEAKPWPSLVLRPVGEERAATVVYLTPGDDGATLGPFPAGDYSASLIAMEFKPDRVNIPVSIGGGHAGEVDFRLTPDGMISGYVTAAMAPEDRPVGMPAANYMPGNENLTVTSLALSGEGIQRTLFPSDEEGFDYYDSWISRTDFHHNGNFQFFGLPAGEYELTVRADGYRPLREKYVVVPGQRKSVRATVLSPEE